MVHRIKPFLTLIASVAVTLVLPGLASAQEDVTQQKVSFGFNRADVRAAIQGYFDVTNGIGCSIADDVRGKVSMSMFDAPWEAGLQKLFRPEGLTYRSEGNIFEIIKTTEQPDMQLTGVTGTSVDYLYSASMDAQRLLRSLFKSAGLPVSIGPYVGGAVRLELKNVSFEMALQRIVQQANVSYTVEGGVYKFVAAESAIDSDQSFSLHVVGIKNIESIDADQSDVRRLLYRMFRLANVSFVIGPHIQGSATLHAKNLPMKEALKQILRQVGANLRIQSGIYLVLSSQR